MRYDLRSNKSIRQVMQLYRLFPNGFEDSHYCLQFKAEEEGRTREFTLTNGRSSVIALYCQDDAEHVYCEGNIASVVEQFVQYIAKKFYKKVHKLGVGTMGDVTCISVGTDIYSVPNDKIPMLVVIPIDTLFA